MIKSEKTIFFLQLSLFIFLIIISFQFYNCKDAYAQSEIDDTFKYNQTNGSHIDIRAQVIQDCYSISETININFNVFSNHDIEYITYSTTGFIVKKISKVDSYTITVLKMII